MSETNKIALADVPTLYVSSVRMAISFTDVRLYLGENVPTNEPDSGNGPLTQKVIDKLCVVFTPDVLPSIVKGLVTAVEQYQKNFGPLREQPGAASQPLEAEQPIPVTQ
jgi:hypothetical protein